MKLHLFVRPIFHLLNLNANPIIPINGHITFTIFNGLLHNAIDVNGDARRLCKQGRWKEALRLLDMMDHRRIRLRSSTYDSLLQECADHRALQDGKLVHNHMTDTGFSPDTFLQTKLVIMYAKCGSLVDARRVFEEMPNRTVVSWTAMIAAYSKHGQYGEALALFYQMQQTGTQADQLTFASVLPSCANLAALEHGKKLHLSIINRGFLSNIYVRNALVDMYAKCGIIEDARQVFDKMPERNVVSWNSMIAGYAQNAHVDEALKLFQEMPERNVISWNTLIAGYAKNEHVRDALKLFEKIPERDEASWNAMIAGYAQNGHAHEALRLFQKMPDPDVVSWTGVMAGCAQCGEVGEALKLFQKMPQRNAVSWNTMIAGYERNGYFGEALGIFQQMHLAAVKPASVTFISVLPACASLSVLKHGKEVHENIIRRGFQFDVFVGSALVDMYAKSGSIDNARRVFDKMPLRDVISWNAMIAGYAMHGCGKEALQLFEQMESSGMKPVHVTFVGILSACCHAGLVDDGWQYFYRMSQEYSITPTVEHYSCMVDLLGRAGHLDEARDFIDKMPMEPSASVWGSLLSACRIHANIELGERVAERLFELEPKNVANYVLISNIYAAAGRWGDVEKVQRMQKDRGIKKNPGCSWIEVNNKVYSFLVNDRSYPQAHEVYAELERLYGQMKEAGYVPNRKLVLHDVEEEQKEHVVLQHSEKLAIAFGLLHLSAGTPIRIVKNLRVCGDCHSATKFISKIVAREIVMRDSSRFHHFKDGQCSCRDYW